MNDRIKQLASQCWDLRMDGQHFDQEKFAELIVRECVEVLLKWKGEPFPFDEDLAASLIKEHFGVK